MDPNMSIMSLFLEASLIVQAVMVGLLLLSVISWTMIFQRSIFMRKAKRALAQFEEQFWSGIEMNKLYERVIERGGNQPFGLAHIFQLGFKEFMRLSQKANISSEAVMDGTQRAMRVAYIRENEKLESSLSFLATIGSTTPYIGLFGTVWGIMHSFIALGQVQQATLEMVAPGIAEALVATAMGLFVAIPAVMAYNRFAYSANRISGHYETFLDEFAGILHREAHK